LIGRAEFDTALSRWGVRSPLDPTADRPVVPVRPLVAAFADLIGDDDTMIAASYAFQSVVSRLAAPTLTGALVVGWAPSFAVDDVRWRLGSDGPTFGLDVIGLDGFGLRPTTPERALEDLLTFVGAWADVMRREVRIARRLLHGNAAAALLATLRRVAALDDVAEPGRCRSLAEHVIGALGKPAVACLVDVDGWTTFQRRTCCLLRFAGARGVCEECSLPPLDRA
jgi:hypothetical protein